MTMTVKDNGYKAEGLQNMINAFNNAVEKLFEKCELEHFYYGDYLDMVDLRTGTNSIGHFNITRNRVSFSGCTCETDLIYKNFTRLTYNDECFKGELLNI